MSRPLSYANVMSTIAVFLALGGGAWAVSGPPTAQTAAATIDACVKKSGKKKGQLRIVSPSTTCKNNENKLTWASGAGPAGPAGPPVPQGRPGRRATRARRASRATRARPAPPRRRRAS